MLEPSSCSGPFLQVHWKMTSCLCLQMGPGYNLQDPSARAVSLHLLYEECGTVPLEAWSLWYTVTPFTTGQVRGMATWTAQSTYLKMSVPQELRSGCKPRVRGITEPTGHSNTTWCLQQPPLQHNSESPVYTAIPLALLQQPG